MVFYLQLLISFLAGGIFIALQTLIGERVRGTWRNIVLTIPSTMALGLFFIGLTKTPSDVVEAVKIIPAGLSTDYIFVVLFTWLARFNLLASLVGSISIWAVTAFILLKFPPATFTISVLICAPVVLVCWIIIKKFRSADSLKQFPLNAKHITIRALISGAIITSAVFLAKTLGSTWGGLFSVFPAAFTSTFIIYYFLQGRDAIATIAKSVFFPGIPGLIIYAWVVALTFPVWDIWLGTLAAYAATFLFFGAYFVAQKLIRRKKVDAVHSSA